MKPILSKSFLMKHRKKALMIYLLWWVLKGLVFLIAWKFFS